MCTNFRCFTTVFQLIFLGNGVSVNLSTGFEKPFNFQCLGDCREYLSFETKTCIHDKN